MERNKEINKRTVCGVCGAMKAYRPPGTGGDRPLQWLPIDILYEIFESFGIQSSFLFSPRKKSKQKQIKMNRYKMMGARDIQIASYPGTGMSNGKGPTMPYNTGMALVLFTQQKCDHCDVAMDILKSIFFGDYKISMYEYDMTHLKSEKLAAMHKADYFPLTMTPTFMLFCNEHVIKDGLISGLMGTATEDLKANRDRVQDHFGWAVERLGGFGCPSVRIPHRHH
jgi:hypothetical protein